MYEISPFEKKMKDQPNFQVCMARSVLHQTELVFIATSQYTWPFVSNWTSDLEFQTLFEFSEVTNTVEDRGGWAVLLRQCHPNLTGPLSLLERSKTPIVFVLFVLPATPQTRGNGQGI